jgi:hypothetical protein
VHAAKLVERHFARLKTLLLDERKPLAIVKPCLVERLPDARFELGGIHRLVLAPRLVYEHGEEKRGNHRNASNARDVPKTLQQPQVCAVVRGTLKFFAKVKLAKDLRSSPSTSCQPPTLTILTKNLSFPFGETLRDPKERTAMGRLRPGFMVC